MSIFTSKYSIEIVNKFGLLLADFSGRAANRRIIQSRNEAEDIYWTIDLNEYERYCRKLGQDPRNLIVPGSTEVRIKRNGVYLCGGQIIFINPKVTESSQVIEFRATGFLNLLASRYTGTTSAGTVTQSFNDVEKTTIAATLINETQALTNGDFGITIGTLESVGIADRTYNRTNLKNAIQNFGNLQSGSFDHEFTHDKVFNAYASIGNNRPDIIFEYPKNIKEFEVPYDGTSIANEVTALGQGIGEIAQASAESTDISSQLNYSLRQKIIVSNGTDNSDGGITNAANSEVATWGFAYQLPSITVDGNISPTVTEYGIGDYVKINLNNYVSINDINGMYRVEKRIIDIDDEDSESVTLITT